MSSNSIENILFYLPDRPTAEKPHVKNLPFKESTDNALNGDLKGINLDINRWTHVNIRLLY